MLPSILQAKRGNPSLRQAFSLWVSDFSENGVQDLVVAVTHIHFGGEGALSFCLVSAICAESAFFSARSLGYRPKVSMY